MRKVWSDEAWEDYLYWQTQDKKTLRKINELIGRICLFPHLYRDPRVCKVISYIRKNSDILLKHHNQLGFSNWGAYAILYVPQSLYLYYRKWK